MRPIFQYIGKFILLILVQVLILKNLELGASNWWITPFVYVLFIVELPIRINGTLVLLLALCMGLIVDVFYDTLGLHASTCLLVAFVRHYLIQVISPRDGFDPNASPEIKSIGLIKYSFYAGILLFAYHTWFFIIETFRFDGIFLRLLQALVSTIFALGIAILGQYLFLNKKTR